MRELVLGVSLDALLDHRGKTPKKLGADFTTSGVPVASAILVFDGRLHLGQARFVPEGVYRRWMPEPTRAGDVLLTSEGPLGRVARVPDDRPLVLGQRLFALRGRPGVLHSSYLYYALLTEYLQGQLLARSTGTTVHGIRQSALREVRVPAPSYEQQRVIAEVLGALDDKITANTCLATTAEELAIASLSAVDASVPLSEIVSVSRSMVSPETLTEPVVAHFSLPAFDAGSGPDRVAPALIKSGKFRVDRPAVLLSKLNPRFPRVWDLASLPGEPALASTEFVVLHPRSCSTAVLWALVSQPRFGVALEGMVAGTSGSHQRVKPAEILATPVGDPRTLSPALTERVTTLGRVAQSARAERLTLAATRDALLPALMSGALRVRDAERVVETLT